MTTLFIGDLHLSADHSYITDAFFRFLDTQAKKAEALYILGDLFEVWLGDDVAEPFAENVASKLRAASRYTKIYYINGNRDFLLSYQYAKRAGMTILPEHHTLSLYDIPTVILHGDTLCTLDESYQKFRKFRNNSFVRWLYFSFPSAIRRSIAQRIRNKSKKSNQGKSQAIMDVEPSAVKSLMKSTQTQRMIHGHTHRPGFNDVAEGKKRIVVGDWYEEGSVLEVNREGISLTTLPF
ncbi:UDP-2,3-diacylglucosamine diphosphatase [Parashewanella spongiae]|uniref:UDP-2,3-diacylglucosamine hydrolase n=1 Tax=Parashewanella spongiae TaxID=342950 RepID=A0A3A6TRI2_9GAMM|nr:UDP-2,3-diacylglucosamine diphosphatase [Parashewanella spongiae]MCL1079328.1 UDP-2,3-diacylglucosamine diphosphatase [Parashewanella spongiae]RJY10402.1 UDP-2,3-diacylglucosamine diphosphatase [Parashewanella spongiae]